MLRVLCCSLPIGSASVVAAEKYASEEACRAEGGATECGASLLSVETEDEADDEDDEAGPYLLEDEENEEKGVRQEPLEEGATCRDTCESCGAWARQGRCEERPAYMLLACCDSCADELAEAAAQFGRPQEVPREPTPEVLSVLLASVQYMRGGPTRMNSCQNEYEDCAQWAALGQCEVNAPFMKAHCAPSCQSCHYTVEAGTSGGLDPLKGFLPGGLGEHDVIDDYVCANKNKACGSWAETGGCLSNPVYMLLACCSSCAGKLSEASAAFGRPQVFPGDETPEVLAVLLASVRYMRGSPPPSQSCQNEYEECALWASMGMCEAKPSLMKVHCAPTCQTCPYDSPCPPPGPHIRPGFRPGELNGMFERILASAPEDRSRGGGSAADGAGAPPPYTVVVHSRPGDSAQAPWVIALEDFLTPEECDHMIQVGHEGPFAPSVVYAGEFANGSVQKKLAPDRTSSSSFCSGDCLRSPVVREIAERIATLTGLSTEHSENWQILKYEVGQYYIEHHDTVAHHRNQPCGPRVLTLFMYLNDVEAGGATSFPRLNRIVAPKRGRALLWPGVLDSDPFETDPRTRHEAHAVQAGTKFAANVWLHLYDFQSPWQTGCAT